MSHKPLHEKVNFLLNLILIKQILAKFKPVVFYLFLRILKPYVRRDYESLPLKLNLNREIVSRSFTMSTAPVERDPIDYVHLRPEHVLQINFMCRQHFWTGIDITECLEYPDHTIVALYRKLIVGFAFLVPNSSYKEAYLSFIFVHPDWRIARSKHRVDESDQASERCDLSIGQYMMFYLIKVSVEKNARRFVIQV
jgi:hypothetical protein